MIVVRDTDKRNSIDKELVATIGFFDGVHLGHRFLIQELIQTARMQQLPSAVITFAKHPRVVLQSDYQPKLLNSFEEKLEHLASTGVDYCIVLDFTAALSRLSAEAFIRSFLLEKLHVKTLLIGHDHRFGAERKWDFADYKRFGAECGLKVMKSASYAEGGITVSSSKIRGLLAEGKVEEVNKLLAYPYQLKGHIINGHKVGRTLGFPTANIHVDEPFKVYPGIGVYAVWVMLKEVRYKGMLYIGDRPTLDNGENVSLEVNIFDFAEDIYTNEITVSFVYYVRGDIHFDSLDELKDQLKRDKEAVDKLLTGI